MGFQGIVDLAKQIRQVGRGLFHSPGFTFTGVVTMALSIGAITTMFSVIKAVLLRPLPYHAPARLVMLWSAVPSKDIQRNWTSYPDIQDWKRESRSFTEIAVMLRVDTADLTETVPVERTKVGRVSSEFFSVLGVTPVLGRDWTQEEEDHRAQVAVISHAFWQSHFAGARNAIGASIEIDHKRAVVITNSGGEIQKVAYRSNAGTGLRPLASQKSDPLGWREVGFHLSHQLLIVVAVVASAVIALTAGITIEDRRLRRRQALCPRAEDGAVGLIGAAL